MKGAVKMPTRTVDSPKVVSRDEWFAARKKLLAKEKQLTRERDAVAAERRKLPWVKVEKNYIFDSPSGKKTLADLFDGRSQLIVYHFMFGPEGCVAKIKKRTRIGSDGDRGSAFSQRCRIPDR
jgi:predicted dithiol-disulfide oxidoreductase (DUF899 family)